MYNIIFFTNLIYDTAEAVSNFYAMVTAWDKNAIQSNNLFKFGSQTIIKTKEIFCGPCQALKRKRYRLGNEYTRKIHAALCKMQILLLLIYLRTVVGRDSITIFNRFRFIVQSLLCQSCVNAVISDFSYVHLFKGVHYLVYIHSALAIHGGAFVELVIYSKFVGSVGDWTLHLRS